MKGGEGELTTGTQGVAVDLVLGVLDCNLFGQQHDGAFRGAVGGCSARRLDASASND